MKSPLTVFQVWNLIQGRTIVGLRQDETKVQLLLDDGTELVVSAEADWQHECTWLELVAIEPRTEPGGWLLMPGAKTPRG